MLSLRVEGLEAGLSLLEGISSEMMAKLTSIDQGGGAGGGSVPPGGDQLGDNGEDDLYS